MSQARNVSILLYVRQACWPDLFDVSLYASRELVRTFTRSVAKIEARPAAWAVRSQAHLMTHFRLNFS